MTSWDYLKAASMFLGILLMGLQLWDTLRKVYPRVKRLTQVVYKTLLSYIK